MLFLRVTAKLNLSIFHFQYFKLSALTLKSLKLISFQSLANKFLFLNHVTITGIADIKIIPTTMISK
jgi:hypothetical protein